MKKIIYIIVLLISLVTLIGCKNKIDLTNDIENYLDNISFNEYYNEEFNLSNEVYDLEIVWEEVDGNYLTISKRETSVKISFSETDLSKEVTIKASVDYKKTVISKTYSFIINKVVEEEKNYYKVTLDDNLLADIDDLDNVLEGSEVLITVNIPDDVIEVLLFINDIEVTLIDDTYIAVVDTDLVLTVEFVYEYVIEEFKPIFKVSNEYIHEHKLNKEFTPPIIDAYDHSGDIDVTVIYNNVNINKEGSYIIIYEAINNLGITSYTLNVEVIKDLELTYYDSITASLNEPELLFNQLRTLISIVTAGNGNQNVSYGQIRDLLLISDVDIDDTSKLRGIYKEEYFNKKWDQGVTWNREHVWPQSRLDQRADNNKRNQASDAHNLRVIGVQTNTDRGNDIFTNITNKGSTYFPSDRDKGDVARIMLYMVLRYDNLSLDITGGSLTMGDIRVFNDWHNDDPVDDFEKQRNDVIEEWQGNRNPFIDNPIWFNAIWKYLMDKSGITILEAIYDTLNLYKELAINYAPNLNNRKELLLSA